MVTDRARILLVDDDPRSLRLLADLLSANGYEVLVAASGAEALEAVPSRQPDLVILDVVMPGMNGYDVCRRIRQNPATAVLPVIMVTALDPAEERVTGLEAGADDFLTKPISQPELFARVRSLLRIKHLFDTVQAQAAELEEWNRTLEQRVQEQVAQIERLGRLRRFLSPQVAEVILSSGDEFCLRSHRRDIATVFCDLRDFTSFSETAEPEDVMDVLTEYHEALEAFVLRFGATIADRAGDGIMAFFNDPLPCDRPGAQAVRMAVAMRGRIEELSCNWRKRGHDLGFGVGISRGYATIGLVGSEARVDYAAVGRAVNLGSRLCREAQRGQILITQRVCAEVEELADVEFVAKLNVKGFRDPVAVFNVKQLRA